MEGEFIHQRGERDAEQIFLIFIFIHTVQWRVSGQEFICLDNITLFSRPHRTVRK